MNAPKPYWTRPVRRLAVGCAVVAACVLLARHVVRVRRLAERVEALEAQVDGLMRRDAGPAVMPGDGVRRSEAGSAASGQAGGVARGSSAPAYGPRGGHGPRAAARGGSGGNLGEGDAPGGPSAGGAEGVQSGGADAGPGQPSAVQPEAAGRQASGRRDEAYPHKFAAPTRLDLNTVDSATLVRVPGIGGRTARAILTYRQRLGGYYSAGQLAEWLTWEGARAYMDEWQTQWFVADTTQIVPLRVNVADFRTLLRHPYLTYAQVEALVRYRERHRRVEGLAALLQMEAFTETDIARLRPYLAFD